MSGASQVSKEIQSLSDEEYNRRFLDILTARIRDEGMQDQASAELFARDALESTPRAEMMAQYAADPELAADDSYEEWRASGDDFDEPDDEWDGDEDVIADDDGDDL